MKNRFALMLVLWLPAAVWGDTTLERLLACGAETGASSRLACFDALVAELSPAVSSATAASPAGSVDGEAVTAEASAREMIAAESAPAQTTTATAAQTAEEAQFGVEHHQSNKTTNEISSLVEAVNRNAMGALVLTLENSQIWQQSDRTRIQVAIGDRVTITRGALSAFYLEVNEGSRRVRVSRVR